MRRSVAFLLALLLTGSMAFAQSASVPKANDSTPPRPSLSKLDRSQPKPERKTALSPHELLDQEETALAFAKANFPELGQLVASLKKQQPKEYQKAIRDLYHTADRLAKVRRQDEARYDLELKTWKCESRIELLMARHKLQPADREKVRLELRKALLERHRLRLTAMKRERAKLAERLERVDKQLDQMLRDQDASVDRLLSKLAPAAKDETTKKASGRRQPGQRAEPKAGQDPKATAHPKHPAKTP